MIAAVVICPVLARLKSVTTSAGMRLNVFAATLRCGVEIVPRFVTLTACKSFKPMSTMLTDMGKPAMFSVEVCSISSVPCIDSDVPSVKVLPVKTETADAVLKFVLAPVVSWEPPKSETLRRHGVAGGHHERVAIEDLQVLRVEVSAVMFNDADSDALLSQIDRRVRP